MQAVRVERFLIGQGNKLRGNPETKSFKNVCLKKFPRHFISTLVKNRTVVIKLSRFILYFKSLLFCPLLLQMIINVFPTSNSLGYQISVQNCSFCYLMFSKKSWPHCQALLTLANLAKNVKKILDEKCHRIFLYLFCLNVIILKVKIIRVTRALTVA